MYSYEDRLRAVELFIKLGRRVRPTIRQLGHQLSLRRCCSMPSMSHTGPGAPRLCRPSLKPDGRANAARRIESGQAEYERSPAHFGHTPPRSSGPGGTLAPFVAGCPCRGPESRTTQSIGDIRVPCTCSSSESSSTEAGTKRSPPGPVWFPRRCSKLH